MKKLLAAAVLALPVLSGCGEKKETPVIEVVGEAKVEKAPDYFTLNARILERGKDRLQGLEAASGKLDAVREALARLEGLETFRIESDEARASTVLPKGCDPEEYAYDEVEAYPEDCAPLDYLASLSFSVEGTPAAAAGAALSMLTELGVNTVGTLEFHVTDSEAARDEAREAALTKAMQIARTLARRAGGDIGGPTSISYTEPGEDLIVVTGSRVRARAPAFKPKVTLALPEQRVQFRAKVTAQFALEKQQTEE